MNRHQPPSLEQRIAVALANQNIGSEALVELIREVEAAAAAAGQSATEQRKLVLDLVASPDAKAAHESVVNAELTRDRLNAAAPKLREKLTEALAAEAKERWWADYKRFKPQHDEAVVLFKEYQQHAEAIAHLFAVAVEVDREVSRLNGSAPLGIDRRLRSVELTARGMGSFSRDNPSLASTVELRDWNSSGRKLWPHGSSASLAAAYAQGVAAPYHPGSNWADPEVRQRRRAEVEKEQQRLAEHYVQATEQQESRLNREERERFGLRS